MKTMLKNLLAAEARAVLRRHKPEVIGVTGSVGKSSAKQAIAAVLGAKYRVRPSPKNYNTGTGLPLAVLGLPAPGSSPSRWLSVLAKGGAAALFGMREYPEMLVLEMGADRSGDIAKLVAIAPPKVGVVTAVAESHAEFFGSVDAIFKEKRVLIGSLPKDGLAVLNRDDERVWAMRTKSAAPVASFGFSPEADVRGLAESLSCAYEGDECGTHVKIAADGATVPVFLPGGLGRTHVLAALAAASVGLKRGMHLIEIGDALRNYQPAPGRMRCLAGIKRTVLIDDTYNAAPASCLLALETLHDLRLAEGAKRIAILGDMLELGPISDEGHAAVGKKAAGSGVDLLVLVGERMAAAERSAVAAGMSADRVIHFSDPVEAGRFAQERMKTGDAVLVKGSRGMRMERAVKELMADPLHAEQLLVEADEDWKW